MITPKYIRTKKPVYSSDTQEELNRNLIKRQLSQANIIPEVVEELPQAEPRSTELLNWLDGMDQDGPKRTTGDSRADLV